MKLSTITLALVQFVNIRSSAVAFRVGSDGNGDLMKKALEEALLVDSQETISTTSADAPPIRNKILGTEVPVS
jgi:hypothetical protein